MTNAASLSATGAVAGQPQASAQRAELAKAAKAFEAVFMRQMIGSMRGATAGMNQLTGSSAVDQFQELADARTAESLADRGGLGIAEMLLRQLSRNEGQAR